MYRALCLAALVMIVFCLALPVSAQQSATASLSGRVTDPAGAVVVEGVATSRSVQTLPLNGRNFLELALLIPGNSPAPNFAPSKSNIPVISSAGQFGRTSNVMIDGADNNDDTSGGPLQNISQDAVQEFQIATSRFSAELGRTGSSVINVVTKSG
jgi:outer membrane receptor protein involved in Fe transport